MCPRIIQFFLHEEIRADGRCLFVLNTDYVAGILKSDTVSPPVDTGKNLSSWVFVRNKAERIHQSSPFFAPYVPVRPVCVQPRKKQDRFRECVLFPVQILFCVCLHSIGGRESSACIWSGVSSKSKTSRFSRILAALADLGMGMNPFWISQRRQICAGDFPCSCASCRSR